MQDEGDGDGDGVGRSYVQYSRSCPQLQRLREAAANDVKREARRDPNAPSVNAADKGASVGRTSVSVSVGRTSVSTSPVGVGPAPPSGPAVPTGAGSAAGLSGSAFGDKALQEGAARKSLQESARARRERQRDEGAVTAGSTSSAVSTSSEPVEDASSMVRRKILETIKRGIQENRGRTDLGEGERRMLDHMQLYVMETKVAETQLSEEERRMWESMKKDYINAHHPSAEEPGSSS
uniref:Uncharacterized protein n=1 Tax=Haptolina brevifila TaxID=156173 RepID=A0A7S2GRP7_9EUKA|mmetsp:Transcript_46122/g.92018  ORF Transcript_46122/g.92018 Transcript_46122/m.92018 type:complete len:236 (+) Transcript_46122:140-847(+)